MEIAKDYIGVGCGALIINKNNEILLQKRNKAPEKGFWSIPGGKVEMFEKLEQALKREIKEETNCDIEIIKLLGICDHIIKEEKRHWISPIFLAKITQGIPKIMETEKHLEMKWFNLKNLPEDLTITTKKAIEDYKN